MAMENNKKQRPKWSVNQKCPLLGKSRMKEHFQTVFPVGTQKLNYPLLLGKRLDIIQDALSSCLCHYMPSRDCSLNMSLSIGGVCDFIRVWHHVCVVAQSLLCSLRTENTNLHLQYCHMKDKNLGANTLQITSLLATKQVIKRGWS